MFGLMPVLHPEDRILQWWEIGTVAELDDLKRKLSARKNKAGYEDNVREIEARIAELEKADASPIG